jgi:DNA-binding NtrC family response regulator
LTRQVEELRRRNEHARLARIAGVDAARAGVRPAAGGVGAAIEPRDQPPPPNVVTIGPGVTMAEIERAAIEAALRETRGNRRRAAELLAIGERTLYRKIRDYQLPDEAVTGG